MDKSLLTLFGLIATVIVLCKLKPEHTEGFLGNLPSMTTKVLRTQQNEKGQFHSIPGKHHSLLEPRNSGGVSYGSYIKAKPTSYDNTAVPKDPLAMSDLVNNCFNPDVQNPFDNTPSNALPQKKTNEQTLKYPEAQSMLPVNNMNSVNALGDNAMPIVYDRFIYANRNSRLRNQGDLIRGDLPIVPCTTSEWMRPSVNPHVDLHEGAMNILAGVDNKTAKSVAELMALSSGGAKTIVGGVNMVPHLKTELGARHNDINITAFH